MMSINIWKENVEKFFIWFILLQPLLDISAYFGLPVSEVIRVIAFGLGFIYLLFLAKVDKKTYLYLALLIVYTLIHISVNFFIKEPYSFMEEIVYTVKTIYFIILLLVYLKVFQAFQSNPNWKRIIYRNVAISISIIIIVLGIAEITDTGRRSYDMLAKSGHTGWFFSGNELSAILAMGIAFFTYQIILLSTKSKTWAWISVIPLFFISWAMMTIGTKVGFGALLTITLFMVAYLVYLSFKQRKIHTHLRIWIIVFVGIIAFTPITAIGQNLNISYPENLNLPSKMVKKNAEMDTDLVPVRVLSGREDFLNEAMSQFKDAPLVQKVFGMGIGGNYKKEVKLVEMDFFDIFFNFGIIGFLLFTIPVIYLLWNIIKNVYRAKKITLEVALLIVSIGLGLGSAFVAGHVLSSPAASFYLAIAIAFCVAITFQWKARRYS